MKKLAVIANREKEEVYPALKAICRWARHNNVQVESNLEESDAQSTRTRQIDSEDEEKLRARFAGSDIAVTLGGDGTLFQAVPLIADLRIPVLTVNLGSLGFHAQVEPSDLEHALQRVHSGDFHTQNRLLLAVKVDGSEKDLGTRVAMNDIVVCKSAWGRMVHLRLNINDQPATDVFADGLVIATPTGSSAYNYAADGPILTPMVDAFVLNAICPHRTNFSPLVVPTSVKVVIEFHPRKPLEEAQILVDGRHWCSALPHEKLNISKSPLYLPLIVLRDDFYQRMREKLRWGGLT